MKAYILSGPGKPGAAWKLVDKPDPVPGAGEVLIGVRAASVNYKDVAQVKGMYPALPQRDFIPLSDGSGDVLAVGEGVSQFKVGDRVSGNFFQNWISGPVQQANFRGSDLGGNLDGMLAEEVVLKAEGVVAIPSNLSHEEAATLPCAALTAWHALFEETTPLLPGSTVLTLGTGGVSIFAFQFAKAAGLKVIGTSSTEAKLDRMRKLGFDHVINYRGTPEWQDEVRKLTGGRGVDHVIEVGGATLERSLKAVGFAGAVSLIGGVAGWTEKVSYTTLLWSGARVRTIAVGSVAMFKAMNRAIEANQIKPVVDEVFPFDRAPEALSKLESGTHFGKIVIRI
ncbi:MAG TPA: NAD(P)-dependent alcohol dehydrogenase [Terriglobales bacterium]|jgi:NADPH:quinone reductase-like Zn-dependent oxidoreductase